MKTWLCLMGTLVSAGFTDCTAMTEKPLKWEARNLPERFRRDCLLHRW